MADEIDRLEIAVDVAAKNANRSLTALERRIGKIADHLEKILPLTSAIDNIGNFDVSGLKKAQDQMDAIFDVEKKISRQKAKPRVDRSDLKYTSKSLDEIYDKFKKVGTNADFSNLGLKELESGLRQSESAAKRLNDRLEKKIATEGTEKLGKSWESLVYDIQKATNQAEMYREAISKIKRSTPEFTITRGENIADASEFERISKAVDPESLNYNAEAMRMVFGEGAEELRNFSDVLKKFGGNAASAGRSINEFEGEIHTNEVKTYEAEIKRLKQTLSELASQGFKQGDPEYDKIAKQLAKVTAEKKKYDKAMRDSANAEVGIKKTDNDLKSIRKTLSQATNALSKFGKGAVKSFGNALNFAKRLGAEITGIRRQSNKGMSFGRMLGTSVAFSFVFQGISAIQNAIKEGSDNLVQYSDTYNQSISSIVSSLTYLKNAWAAAFSPIVNVVAPYLSAFIDMIASALNSVGQFLAALTGKGFAVQAKKVMQDYGASLADTSSNAKDAADAMKDLESYTLGIDELNVIQSQSPSGSGAGNGGSGGASEISPSEMFETIEVGGALSDFAKRIREAFLAEDWEGLGEILADGVNTGLQKLYDVINWNNVGPKITKFANAFTTTFNSLVDNINWTLMGNTVGAGINTVVNTANLFLEGINWKNLGISFGTGIMGIVDEVNWTNLGTLLGNKFMLAWNIFWGVVTTLEWDEVGKSLADGFNGMLSEISLGDIGTTIGTIVAGIIEMFREFFANADWSEVAKQVKDGLSNALSAASDGGKNDGILAGILGVGAIAGISKAILDIIPFLADIKQLFGNGTDTSGAEVIGTIDGIKNSLKGKVGSIVDVFKNGSSNISKYLNDIALNASIAFEATGSSTSGILSTVSSAFSNVFGKLAGLSTGATFGIIIGAIALIGAGIKDLWDTSETFRDNVSKMWDKISDAFVSAKEKIWDDALQPLGENISDFFSSLYDLYEASGIKKAFEWLVTFIGDVLTNNISGAIDVIGTVFGTAINIVSDLISALSGAIDFVTGIFTGDWDKAWSGVEKITDGVVGAIADLFSGLWETIKNIFLPVIKFFSDTFKNAYKAITDIFKSIGSWFSDRWNDIKNVFSGVQNFFYSGFSNAYSSIQSVFQSIGSWFQGRWKDIKSVFSNVKNFFQSAFKNAYDAVTKVWNEIGGFFKGIANTAIKPIGKLVNGIIDGVNWIGNKLGVGDVLSNWSVPKFAKGSNGIQRDTLGVVNDQKGATYKELVLPPNGKPFIPRGRNVMLPLQKGTKIMPADQTKEFMKMTRMPHFASGIGDFFNGAWEKVKDIAGSIWDYMQNPEKILQIAINKFVDMSSVFEPWTTIAGGVINKLFDGAVDFIKGLFDKAVPEVNYNPSSGVEQWRALAKKALQMTGQYTEANLNRLLMQMQTESGGNPNAINNWDINAKNGTPSKGLMQVIDPTFKRWAMDGYDTNIWDPLSNMLAAIRYTVNRYGSLSNGWKGHGYASGIGVFTMSDFIRGMPKLADGGVLSSGQIFMARENGSSEFIGRYGNRTGVINNDQIVQAVSNGVATAVDSAAALILNKMEEMLEVQEQIRDKKNVNNIDGKRADKLISRARKNSGYSFIAT